VSAAKEDGERGKLKTLGQNSISIAQPQIANRLASHLPAYLGCTRGDEVSAARIAINMGRISRHDEMGAHPNKIKIKIKKL
jgi:hypothetical protein